MVHAEDEFVLPDMNSLFTLTYNFDNLKKAIEYLAKKQKVLTKDMNNFKMLTGFDKINEVYGEEDDDKKDDGNVRKTTSNESIGSARN